MNNGWFPDFELSMSTVAGYFRNAGYICAGLWIVAAAIFAALRGKAR